MTLKQLHIHLAQIDKLREAAKMLVIEDPAVTNDREYACICGARHSIWSPIGTMRHNEGCMKLALEKRADEMAQEIADLISDKHGFARGVDVVLPATT